MNDPLDKIWITDRERLKQLEHRLSQRGKAKDNQLNNDILAAAKKYAADLGTCRDENQRLREALEGMLRWFGQYPEFIPSHEDAVQNYVEIVIEQARAALAAPRKE